MRVISFKKLREFWQDHPDAEKPLTDWFRVTVAAKWRNFMEVRQTFGSSDIAVVGSGHTVTIFDVRGNKYRLIASIHYNTGIVYAMAVLTHKEYDKDKWKARL